jgi:hypothetical protein
MPEYRIYFVDPSGRFQGVEIIHCVSDQQAIAKARQYIDGHDLEVWQRDRFVTRMGRE